MCANNLGIIFAPTIFRPRYVQSCPSSSANKTADERNDYFISHLQAQIYLLLHMSKKSSAIEIDYFGITVNDDRGLIFKILTQMLLYLKFFSRLILAKYERCEI